MEVVKDTLFSLILLFFLSSSTFSPRFWPESVYGWEMSFVAESKELFVVIQRFTQRFPEKILEWIIISWNINNILVTIGKKSLFIFCFDWGCDRMNCENILLMTLSCLFYCSSIFSSRNIDPFMVIILKLSHSLTCPSSTRLLH